MHPNFLFVPVFVVAFCLFLVGLKTARTSRPRTQLVAVLVVAGALAVPALFFVAYYSHRLDRASWFYSFRAAPYSELAASGLGLGGGLLAGLAERVLRKKGRIVQMAPIAGAALLCSVVLFVPYIKPLFAPIHDKWVGEVCLQTSPSTCGPASAATLLRQFHILASESDLARECFSYRGGTENWYVARALQHHGLATHYLITSPQPAVIPLPSMAGVQMGGPLVDGVQTGRPSGRGGHFITILARQDDNYVIGDPLVGRLVLTPQQLRTRYYFTGFFLSVSRS